LSSPAAQLDLVDGFAQDGPWPFDKGLATFHGAFTADGDFVASALRQPPDDAGALRELAATRSEFLREARAVVPRAEREGRRHRRQRDAADGNPLPAREAPRQQRLSKVCPRAESA
jgi:hypothetical protein